MYMCLFDSQPLCHESSTSLKTFILAFAHTHFAPLHLYFHVTFLPVSAKSTDLLPLFPPAVAQPCSLFAATLSFIVTAVDVSHLSAYLHIPSGSNKENMKT